MPGPHYTDSQWSLVQNADKALALELLCPFPLILIGVLRVLEPLLVGVGIGLGLLPWLARWLVLGRSSHPTFIGGALALLGSSGLVGVWASYDPTLSWPLLLTLLGSISLFFAVANTGFPSRRVGEVLGVTAGLLAFYFVGQYGYFYYPYEGGWLPDLGRLTGSVLPNFVIFTLHPNAVAGFLASGWLLSLVLTWQARGGERVVWMLTAVVVSYGLLISESRGAWLGLVAVAGIWAWLIIPRRNLRLALGGVGLLGAALGFYVFYYGLSNGLEIPFLSPTLNTAQSRLILYRNSLNLWGDYLVTGIGLGDTFAFVYSRYQLLIPYRFLSYAHNLFLSVGLGLGLLGVTALIWLLFSFYQFVIKAETKGDFGSSSLSLFRAAWLGATATFIHGLTDAPQLAGSGWTMPMLFAILGLTVAVGRPALLKGEDNEKVDEGLVSPYRRGLWVKVGVIAGLLIIVAIFWRSLLSTWYVNMGAIHQTRADLASDLGDSTREAEIRLAVDDFAHALNLNPAQAAANRRLGLIALDRENFETAVAYLEQAYPQEPGNQATLKALGLTYLWLGRLNDAEVLLWQLDDRGEMIEELGNWSNWRKSQGQIELSNYAYRMAQRLKSEEFIYLPR